MKFTLWEANNSYLNYQLTDCFLDQLLLKEMSGLVFRSSDQRLVIVLSNNTKIFTFCYLKSERKTKYLSLICKKTKSDSPNKSNQTMACLSI